MRVPLVLAGPGVPGWVRDDALVYQASIYPTLCALTGVPAHREVVERLPRLLRARQNELGGDCGEWTIEIDDSWPAVKTNA